MDTTGSDLREVMDYLYDNPTESAGVYDLETGQLFELKISNKQITRTNIRSSNDTLN